MIKILQFNDEIIGVPFSEGYRIPINNLSNNEIINFLSDNFGEGVVDNENCTESLVIINPSWVFSDIRLKYLENKIIVVKDLDMLEKFTNYFNIKYEIDSSQLVENRLFKKIQKFLHEQITQKNQNRIRDIIQKELKTKFKMFIDCTGISISYKQNNNIKNIHYGI